MAGRGYVLMDVDGTIACGRSAPNCRARPGMLDTLAILWGTGMEIALWSAGGAAHAKAVAERCGYDRFVARYYDKPDHPMTMATIPGDIADDPPLLQVDDEPNEKVQGCDWPFFLIDGWYGDMEETPSGLLIPSEVL